MAEARVVKFCTQVGYIKYWAWEDKLPIVGVLGSRDQFLNFRHESYLRNGLN